MRKFLFVAAAVMLLAASALAHQSSAAHADELWCFDEPAVVVNGVTVQVWLAVPQSQQSAVSNSTVFITVPANVDAHLLPDTPGPLHISTMLIRAGSYSGSGAVPVAAAALVKANSTIPTQLIATENGATLAKTTGATGTPLFIAFSVR